MNMKVMILGASGYIGSAFMSEIYRRGFGYDCPSREEYSSFHRLCLTLIESPCDLVINCAAFVAKPSVDFNEDHKNETLAANLVLPLTIANACQSVRVPLLHISTGCVYNGNNNGKGFSEADPPMLNFDNGCGFYVGSKILAEWLITYPKTYICRIRLPFDQFDHERNYLSKIMRYQKVYSNTNSISHRGDFARACLDLVLRNASYGVYNVTNPGSISARQIVELMRHTICPFREFEFWEEADFMANSARTLKSNCTLDVSKLLAAGVRMRHVQDAVEDSLENWKAQ